MCNKQIIKQHCKIDVSRFWDRTDFNNKQIRNVQKNIEIKKIKKIKLRVSFEKKLPTFLDFKCLKWESKLAFQVPTLYVSMIFSVLPTVADI